MSTTAQQVFDIAMDLLDERLSTGSFKEADIAVYKAKSLGIMTVLQAELIEQGDIFSTHNISNYPATNLLGGFFYAQYEGDELIYEGKGGVTAYYFEVDDDATVYAEDLTGSWNTLETITATPTASGFTAYKGVLTATSGATRSRLRFAGTNNYRIANVAMFDIPIASDDDVPVYRKWVEKEMPSDFWKLVEIVNEYGVGEYAKDPYYKWEGQNKLFVNYDFKGNIRITYRPVPSIISALANTLLVADVTARLVMPYGLAAHLQIEENADMAKFYQERYEELKARMAYNKPISEEDIVDVYGGFGG